MKIRTVAQVKWIDDNDYSGTSDTDLDSSETEDTGSDGTDDIVEIN